jgi:guanylate kinase
VIFDCGLAPLRGETAVPENDDRQSKIEMPTSKSAVGPLIILSGPSGSGKSTVIQRLLGASDLPLRLSVSATTRQQRKNETPGEDYYFLSRQEFEEALARNEFLEWAEVYGNYYGTLRSEVEPYRRKGSGVLLDIDVQGAEQVRRACPDSRSIFLAPPSLPVLERRLRQRGTEDEATIQRRLAAAEAEMARQNEYDHVVLNDTLDRAVADVEALVKQFFRGKLCSTN